MLSGSREPHINELILHVAIYDQWVRQLAMAYGMSAEWEEALRLCKAGQLGGFSGSSHDGEAVVDACKVVAIYYCSLDPRGYTNDWRYE